MFDHRKFGAIFLVCMAALLLTLPSIGCGDNRPKIVRPDNPTPVPDESKRLHIDPSHAPSPQQQGDGEAKGGN